MRKASGQKTTKTMRYVHWRDHGTWVAYFEDYPDYLTQGETVKELHENLKDLYEELTGGHLTAVRKVSKLRIA